MPGIMSAAARWSQTKDATLWPLTSTEDWGGAQGFGAPVAIKCDYKVESRRARSSSGDEFTTRLIVYTERAGIKQGDRLALGVSTAADPLSVGAEEVRAVDRYADPFQRLGVDDYVVMC